MGGREEKRDPSRHTDYGVELVCNVFWLRRGLQVR